ncbi:MAG: PQQ-dependent sugar dehydrogenase [Myxococcales bacterium]|nr:PQQ-dependent sugar dehydrogenase [Myxococcales bacterium]
MTSVWIAGLAMSSMACRPITRAVVKQLSDERLYERPSGMLAPAFTGADVERPQLEVALQEVATGFTQPVALEFVPGAGPVAVVLERTGTAWLVDLQTATRTEWLTVDVATDGEQGLLGLAFHPRFERNGLFYLNYVKRTGRDHTVVEAWEVTRDLAQPRPIRTVYTVEQPYQNHNGGQLAFGPDGRLYVGLGDGGARNDPHDNGQDATTPLGSILRLDVDAADPIPLDNPVWGEAAHPSEVFAIGLRNPWRFTFTPTGALVVGDVGQNDWEEISLVTAGSNLGWRLREGHACFRPRENCPTEGLTDPIHSYGHTEGLSVTGGHVATGDRVPALRDRYVFGDFVTGRIWALTIPEEPRSVEVTALGQWPLLLVSFGLDEAGDLYVVDYGRGAVHAIVPATPERTP